MATYVLDGKASATLPRRPLAVQLATATPTTGVRLAARTADGASTRVIQQSPGLLILPRVDVETTIVAVPDAGRSNFDQGTVVHVSFGPDGGNDPSADIAQLTPRDVSGMSFIELATVAPDGPDTLVVQTRLTIPDAPLPPLAAKARVACRGVLRLDQVPAADAVTVRCIVDSSASMAALIASGAVAAAGDVVAGVAAVVGDRPTIACTRADGATEEIAPADLGEFLSRPPGNGFGLLVGSRPTSPAVGRSLTVVITDGPGTGLTTGTGPRSGEATLVISPSRAATTRPGFIGAQIEPPQPGGDPREALIASPERLTTVVAGLLAATELGSVRR
ncbi:hypothetical protein [Gordonia sp. NB41Y]|uniref:hypothetical protein n=1 Tax=Gordonia sp. NB41Y TaxID=875808 RepID=UPI0006B1A5A8|nr:hypothetical protein [Gordonia sp. NB41Y]WLP88617.1 hypothetical protein Q9K23_13375 [Gordonia sp. NB41Y]